MTSPPPLTPIVEEESQVGGDQAVEEGYPPKAVPTTTQTGKDGAAKKQTAVAVDAVVGTTGSEAGIFRDYGSFKKI